MTHVHLLERDRALKLEIADITVQEVDAIINPANAYLRHGGGVAGALVRAGGREIQLESDALVRTDGPLEVSGVAVTGAGTLKVGKIIHVLGPRLGEKDIEEKLHGSFMNVYKKAGAMGIVTLATPAISTGIFGVSVRICAREFFRATVDYFKSYPSSSLKLVKMCLINSKTYSEFLSISFDYFNSKQEL
ncbi:MAG TPA: macro domain-containing protein [Mesotoga sp.]|nr:macro domain-containing protein [Mesotoga sp.]HPX21329.1 macro domain-containing protein [Mesotoga sp.]